MFEDYFVTCNVAVALKGAGFDEPCMASWERYKALKYVTGDKLHIHYSNFPTSPDNYNDTIKAAMLAHPGLFAEKRKNSEWPPWLYVAPLYDQVFDWLLNKGLYLHPYKTPGPKWGVNIYDIDFNHVWPNNTPNESYHYNQMKYLHDGKKLALTEAILQAIKLLPNEPETNV